MMLSFMYMCTLYNVHFLFVSIIIIFYVLLIMTFIQARPMEQAPQGMGAMPPAPTAGYTQQRVQAPAAATPYGATAGYPQQQPQQQYQQQAQGYGECLHVSSNFNGVVVNRSKYFFVV